MIVGLSGRRDLERVRREGTRTKRGPLLVQFRPGPPSISRVAFAIPRSVGTAVRRNRTRRRITAILRDLDSDGEGIAPGDYLIRVTAPLDDWSHQRLRTTMIELLSPAVSR